MWNEYKHQRNFTTNLIKKKKRQWIADLVSCSEGKQTKKLWSTLRNTQPEKGISELVNITNHTTATSANDIANLLNHHFVNITQKYSNTHPTMSNKPDLSKSNYS